MTLWKGGDFMKNNFLSTLFVGIDVSSKTNVLCALDFQGNKLLNLKALNNQPGAESILSSILDCLLSNNLKFVVIALILKLLPITESLLLIWIKLTH